MAERFEYSTATFDHSNFKVLEHEHDLLEGIGFSDDIADFQKVEFSKDAWAYVRVSRFRNSGEVHWSNTIFKDEGLGLDFMYDYNYLNRAFQHDPDEQDGPYRVVLGIDQKAKELVSGELPIGFHAFWYDHEGQLTVIKDQTIFPVERPKVSLKRTGSTWKVLFFEHVNDEVYSIVRAHREGRKYSTDDHKKAQLKAGEEVVVDELVYSLTQSDGTLRYELRTATGSKSRTLIVPNPVDIDKFKNLIGSPNWPNLLSDFPIESKLK